MTQDRQTRPLTDAEFAANFADLPPPLSADAARAEAARCLYCHDAPCITACPTHIDIPSFIGKIATGNLRGSARTILDANPMGHSCARACPVEVLCEGACVMHGLGRKAIEIGRLQRHATDHALAKGLRLFVPGADTGKRVAIVGAGPAGLSAAQDLRRAGHAVVIFESKPLPGGLNTYGIAQYKLQQKTALAEAQMVLDLGVELRSNTTIGRDVTAQALLDDYDAVFVAVGLGETQALGVPGEDLRGVVDALTFIERLKTRPVAELRVGRRVVVIGAGNTAIDAATQARRLGAERVTIVYRRSRAEMPAYDYEYELAKADGCEFRFLTAPVRIVGTAHVEGVACVRMQLGEPDASGRRSVSAIAGSEHTLDVDVVIKALGQTKREALLRQFPGVRLEAGRVVVDPRTGQTHNEKVFAGGDCTSGGAEIVNAAADGKRAAAGIHAMLATESSHG